MSLKLPKLVEDEDMIAQNIPNAESDDDACVCGHCAIPENEMSQNLLINIMNTANIQDCGYDKNEFNKGVAEMSKTAGMITALVNAGLMPSEALEYICAMNTNDTTYKLQTELSKQNNNANIAIAKISGETAMKQQF